MNRATIKNSIVLFALIALSACATQDTYNRPGSEHQRCDPPNTLTCDRFAGENHNCTCVRGDKLKDILDSY